MNFQEFVQYHKYESQDELERKALEAVCNLMIDMHWTWKDFQETPIPVIIALFRTFEQRRKREEEELKKSRRGLKRGR